MTTPPHPYQPGTVWAPKPPARVKRKVVDAPRHAKPHPRRIWWMGEHKLAPQWSSLAAFRRWAGDIIGGCPAGHGDQCCGNSAACLEALRDD